MNVPKTAPKLAYDPSSLANINDCRVSHVDLSLTADFQAKILKGHVIHRAKIVKDRVSSIILDSSFLQIHSVSLLNPNGNKIDLKFQLGERDPLFGSALNISLPSPMNKDSELALEVKYQTTPKTTAIQWLTPAQTVGKTHPYLFTQCQAIHARSLLPCQDSPNLKITYSAEITVPKELTAVMSALKTGVSESGSMKTFKFSQPCTIPSYLIALAVGNLVVRDIGPRTTVYCEPEVIEAAAWEFVETESFIKTGEELLTPYSWGRYDLLCLPASFPYGGMENPCLTFITPTLLSGDRSLVDVIAHEIAHSWCGNLVTTTNWEHFWLNEGFTMFVERKIIGRLRGNPEAEFSALIGVKALKESIEHYQEIQKMEHTALVPDLKGVDPDDAFSSVPYEKGFNFLYYLERILGGPSVFEPFLRAHIEKFTGMSISTDDFKNFLYSYMKDHHGEEKVKILDSVDWKEWLNGDGMPPVENKFDETLAKQCIELAERWNAARNIPVQDLDFKKNDMNEFTPGQKMMFLERLTEKEPLPIPLLVHMQKMYELFETKNCEIKFRWYSLCLASQLEDVFPFVTKFVTEVGRMKYVRPLYRGLFKCRNGKDLARKTFFENKEFYHPICGAMVAKDLGVEY